MADVHDDPRWKQIRWSLAGNGNRRRAYVGMEKRLTVQDVIDYLAEHAPDIPLDQAALNFATLTWERDATPEELAEREAMEERARTRHEEWERMMLERLTEKYPDGPRGPQQVSNPPADQPHVAVAKALRKASTL